MEVKKGFGVNLTRKIFLLHKPMPNSCLKSLHRSAKKVISHKPDFSDLCHLHRGLEGVRGGPNLAKLEVRAILTIPNP